ncbi:flagellin FliC [Halomonas sp. MCCC 1A17488]|uniref:flagellin N-terminal helical domain-containing protein n=1 Tax=unclassified Halomonas TaxID=2609666 RepID=UPI0018D22884|nr:MULTISPECIES: flagellin [unclassified Halomonas]MCE8014808.1 flagellin FliC [Halomonas sp. MCCC 1A17488]MCG3238141.1 flagellin FliC [Halomonas sp. MCCC 1A17488]QPP48091.1 flagellin FliC [Halomonas sp. SS10-MC5]
MSVINTNITALIGQNNLKSSQSMLAKAQERLSSGLRINSSADDAAGQAIANRMSAQIKGMQQAQRNANDGISMVQTMEGGLNQLSDNLQRIRELAVQAANDTNSADDRASIQLEIDKRVEEITRIAEATTFNDTALLSNSATLNIQVGANTGTSDSIEVETVSMTASDIGLTNTAVADIDVTSFASAQAAIDVVDAALQQIDDQRATLGATLNRFDSVVENLTTNVTNLSEARSRIEDADYAVEVSNMTRANILQQAGTSMLAQANQTPQSVLSLLG